PPVEEDGKKSVAEAPEPVVAENNASEPQRGLFANLFASEENSSDKDENLGQKEAATAKPSPAADTAIAEAQDEQADSENDAAPAASAAKADPSRDALTPQKHGFLSAF